MRAVRLIAFFWFLSQVGIAQNFLAQMMCEAMRQELPFPSTVTTVSGSFEFGGLWEVEQRLTARLSPHSQGLQRIYRDSRGFFYLQNQPFESYLWVGVATDEHTVVLCALRGERSFSLLQPQANEMLGMTAAQGRAPRFTRWYFTGCTAGGTFTVDLVAGTSSRCTLRIEYQPNGTRPVAASFTYRLVWMEGSTKRTLDVDGTDYYLPGDFRSNVGLADNGFVYNFELPISVRSRPDRRYSEIVVTGVIRFSNGSQKTVIEPLRIAHRR